MRDVADLDGNAPIRSLGHREVFFSALLFRLFLEKRHGLAATYKLPLATVEDLHDVPTDLTLEDLQSRGHSRTSYNNDDMPSIALHNNEAKCLLSQATMFAKVRF